MPRRNRPERHAVAPDPVYNSESLAKFMNIVMRGGKRSVAEKIMYDALRRASRQAKKEPLDVFDQALRNATPLLEVKPRRKARLRAAGRFQQHGRGGQEKGRDTSDG